MKRTSKKRTIKKQLSWVLTLSMVLSMFAGMTVTAGATAGGSADDPILVINQTNLQDALNNASASEASPTYIQLGEGWSDATTMTSALTVVEGTYVVLDLNGHTIDRGFGSRELVFAGEEIDNLDGYVIKVEGSLTLNDSSDDPTGTITGGYCYYDDGDLRQGDGGGVYVYGTFIMNGGTITGNKAYSGGGVGVDSGIFTMNGGTITGNKAYSGGGVCVSQYGIFTMNGGSISNNTAATDGGGVCVNSNGSFTMIGGDITDNTAATNGGGVYADQYGTFDMSGGTITNNTAATNGGGVYTEKTMTVGGNASITGNTKGGDANNLYLRGTNKIGLSGTPLTGTVGVTKGSNPNTGNPVQLTTDATTDETALAAAAGKIVSDNASYGVGQKKDGSDKKLWLYVPADADNYISVSTATPLTATEVEYGTEVGDTPADWNSYFTVTQTAGEGIPTVTRITLPSNTDAQTLAATYFNESTGKLNNNDDLVYFDLELSSGTATIKDITYTAAGYGSVWSPLTISITFTYSGDSKDYVLTYQARKITYYEPTTKGATDAWTKIAVEVFAPGANTAMTQTKPDAAKTPDGKQLSGWSTTADGNTLFTFGSPLTGDIDLYPIWGDHTHTWGYTADDNVITATCTKNSDHTATLTLTADDADYSGSAVTASYGDGEADAWKDAVGTDAPSIEYEAKDGSELTDGKAVEVGKYTAKITVDGKTASVDFEIRAVLEPPKFDSCGGSAVTLNSDKNGPSANPTWKTYTFDGWYTSAFGGTKATTFSDGETYYAHWKSGDKTVVSKLLDFTSEDAPTSGPGFTWNKATNTLTLTNFLQDCSSNVTNTEYTLNAIKFPAKATVKLSGDNQIISPKANATNKGVVGIAGKSGGSGGIDFTTVSGTSATLKIDVATIPGSMTGIQTGGASTISNGAKITVNVAGNEGTGSVTGYTTGSGKLTIDKDSSLTVTSNAAGTNQHYGVEVGTIDVAGTLSSILQKNQNWTTAYMIGVSINYDGSVIRSTGKVIGRVKQGNATNDTYGVKILNGKMTLENGAYLEAYGGRGGVRGNIDAPNSVIRGGYTDGATAVKDSHSGLTYVTFTSEPTVACTPVSTLPTFTYGTASAEQQIGTVSISNFESGTAAYSFKWYDALTGGNEITEGTPSASIKDTNKVVVSTTATTVAKTYYLEISATVGSDTAVSKRTAITIIAGDYTGTKTASGNLKAKNGSSVTVTLPTIPDGASYGTVSNSNTEFFTVGTISDGQITVTSAKDWDKNTETSDKTFTIPVTGAANYNDYTVTVTITPIFHTHNFTFEFAEDSNYKVIATCGNADGDCDLDDGMENHSAVVVLPLSNVITNEYGSYYVDPYNFMQFENKTGLELPDIKYYKVDEYGVTTGGTSVAKADITKEVGSYYGELTVGDKTIKRSFRVVPEAPNYNDVWDYLKTHTYVGTVTEYGVEKNAISCFYDEWGEKFGVIGGSEGKKDITDAYVDSGDPYGGGSPINAGDDNDYEYCVSSTYCRFSFNYSDGKVTKIHIPYDSFTKREYVLTLQEDNNVTAEKIIEMMGESTYEGVYEQPGYNTLNRYYVEEGKLVLVEGIELDENNEPKSDGSKNELTISSVGHKSGNTYLVATSDNQVLEVIIDTSKNKVLSIRNYSALCGALHEHNWQYSATGNKLEVYCANEGCPSGKDETHKLSLTLIADNQSYSGDVVTAKYGDGEADAWKEVFETDAPAITYEAKTGSELTDGKAVNIGSYTAKITVNGKTASVDYEITKTAAMLLEEAKEAAKEAIATEKGEDTSDNVVKAATSAVSAIDDATAIEDVTTAKETGIAAIKAAKKANEDKAKEEAEKEALAKALAEAKEAAKKAIATEKGEDETANVVKAAEGANKAIEDATTIDAVTKAKEAGIEAIKAAKKANEEAKYVPDTTIDKEVEQPKKEDVLNITPSVKDNDLSAVLKDDNIKEAVELTEEEKTAGVWVWMELVIKEEKNVPEKDVKQVTENLNDAKLGKFISVEMFKQVAGQNKVNITATKEPVAIKVTISEDLRANNREYAIARVHDGKYEQITEFAKANADYDLVFKSDKFSTYAIIYKDAPKDDENLKDGWRTIEGKDYWYEGGVRQGVKYLEDGTPDVTYRGKEIFDPDSNAWYWLDCVGYGNKTVSKDVYQESLAGEWGVATNEAGEKIGKWVRYDENGKMIKGWQTTEAGKYYFDLVYGTMAKGSVVIDGEEYTFDEVTGVLVDNAKDGWRHINGKDYWYEGGVRQGVKYLEDGTPDVSYRGKEIFDPDSNAWYWLDCIDYGNKTVSKDVYQESLAGEWGVATNEAGERIGKWVRYDENGKMIKGWQTTEAGTYYFDLIYGTMAKGTVTIEGVVYTFDEVTGILIK